MKMKYSVKEERINSLSHAAGIVLGVVAGYFLLQKARLNPDPFAIGSIIVYLCGMLSSYIASTCYHGTLHRKKKAKLRKFDHAAIYLHIAATYTPFTLLAMREYGFWGWGIFILVWLSAIVGVILSYTNLKEHSNLETISFVAMGCSILVAMKPLMDSLTAADALSSFWWLIAGGVSYIVGAVFYSLPRIKYMHCTFHVFCLGGSICHIVAIWLIL
ncbi:hemolysin III family protein [Bacteroides sp. 214]|nr:hemolysin III family protein [Bacteroides sp. 214]